MKVKVIKENDSLPIGSVGYIEEFNKEEGLVKLLNSSMFGTFYYILPLNCVKFIEDTK